MVDKKFKIIWTKSAKNSLKDIYDFYKPKSLQAAKKVVNEIVYTAKNIKYTEQYQVDEIDDRYRRMVISNFKILYSFKDETIRIHRVFDVHRDPKKLKE